MKFGIATFCWRNLIGNIFLHLSGESSIPQTPWTLYLIAGSQAPQLDKGFDFTSSIHAIKLLFARLVAFLQRPEGLNNLAMNVFFFYYTAAAAAIPQ
jgi:hypothetical protein